MSAKLSTPASQSKRLPSPRAKKDDKKKGKQEPEIIAPVVIPLTLLQQPTPFDAIVSDPTWSRRSWTEQRSDLATALALTDSILGFSTCDSIRLDLAFEMLMFTRSMNLNGAQTALVYLLHNMLIDTVDQSKQWLNERMRLILSTHCSEPLPGTEHVDTDHLLPVANWTPVQPVVIDQPAPALLSPTAKEKPSSAATASKSSPRPPSRSISRKEIVEPEPVIAPEPPPPAPRPADLTWNQITLVYNWLHSRVMGRLDLIRFALQAKQQTKVSREIVWRMKKYQPQAADVHPLDSAVEETTIEQPVEKSNVSTHPSTLVSPKGLTGTSFPAVNEFELPLPAHADQLVPEEHAILLEKRDVMQKQLENLRQNATLSATG